MNFHLVLHLDPAEVRRFDAKLDLIFGLVGSTAKETRTLIMALADDFNAVLAKIAASQTNISTELKSEADKIVAVLVANGIDPAIVSAGIAKLNGFADSMDASVKAARDEIAAATPTPPPATAPTDAPPAGLPATGSPTT